MIQRKQTVYLFFCIVCFIICAVIPLGKITPEGMGAPAIAGCIGVVDPNTGVMSYPYYALPVFFLALNAFQSLAIIFMYKNRKAQALNCYIQFIAILTEYIVAGALVYVNCISGTGNHFSPSFGLCLPVVALIFLLLAHKGIMDDERLVRAADRIR